MKSEKVKQAALEFGNGIKIYVDRREHIVAEHLAALGAEVIKQDLQVDFVPSARVGIERKTAKDFAASIIDRRLFQQAANLSENFERAIFIIEGSIEDIEIEIAKAALVGAMVALVLDFGSQILFSSGEEQTAQLIYAIAKREQEKKERAIATLPKRRAFSTEYQQLRVLEAFPGIGPKSARALLREFKSLKKIFGADAGELAQVIGKAKAKVFVQLIAARSGTEIL